MKGRQDNYHIQWLYDSACEIHVKRSVTKSLNNKSRIRKEIIYLVYNKRKYQV